MRKKSDFIYNYLSSLSSKEQQKLLALLEIDNLSMELKIVEILLSMKIYNEKELLTKSGYKKESLDTVKSKLKDYLFSTGGYQTRLKNQSYLNRLGHAQSLQRMGFVEEAQEQFNVIEKLALSAGDNYTLHYAYSYRSWTEVMLGRHSFNHAHSYFMKAKGIREWEDKMEAHRLNTLSLFCIFMLDPSLRIAENKESIKQVKLFYEISNQDYSQSVFDMSMLFIARTLLLFFDRKYTECAEVIGMVLKTSRFNNLAAQSNEIAFIYEIQCSTSLYSKQADCFQYVNNYEIYIKKHWSFSPAYMLKMYTYTTWHHVQVSNYSEAEKSISNCLEILKGESDKIYDTSKYHCVVKLMLLVLNFDLNLQKEVAKISLKIQNTEDVVWNKAFRTNARILNLFILFNEEMKGGKQIVKIKEMTMTNYANQSLDVFKKAKRTEQIDYKFEMLLCRIFEQFSPRFNIRNVSRQINKFIKSDCFGDDYGKMYLSYFDFSKWAKNLSAILIEE